MDCSPPGSSVNGILLARMVEWGAISSSGDLPNPGIEPISYSLLHWQVDSLPLVATGKPLHWSLPALKSLLPSESPGVYPLFPCPLISPSFYSEFITATSSGLCSQPILQHFPSQFPPPLPEDHLIPSPCQPPMSLSTPLSAQDLISHFTEGLQALRREITHALTTQTHHLAACVSMHPLWLLLQWVSCPFTSELMTQS